MTWLGSCGMTRLGLYGMTLLGGGQTLVTSQLGGGWGGGFLFHLLHELGQCGRVWLGQCGLVWLG